MTIETFIALKIIIEESILGFKDTREEEFFPRSTRGEIRKRSAQTLFAPSSLAGEGRGEGEGAGRGARNDDMLFLLAACAEVICLLILAIQTR